MCVKKHNFKIKLKEHASFEYGIFKISPEYPKKIASNLIRLPHLFPKCCLRNCIKGMNNS